MRSFIKRLFRWLILAIGLSIPLTALAFSASNPNNEQVITPLQEEATFDESINRAPVEADSREDESLTESNASQTSQLLDHPPSSGEPSAIESIVSGRPYSQEEVIQLIHHWAEYFSVPVEHPLRIFKCESNYRWDAKNKSSSASGVAQYLSGTWANTPEGKAGLSVFDADANIRAAIRHMSVHGYSAWECK